MKGGEGKHRKGRKKKAKREVGVWGHSVGVFGLRGSSIVKRKAFGTFDHLFAKISIL